MSLLPWLGIGQEIAKDLDAVSNLYTTDKARLEGQTKLEEQLNKPVLAQIENNRIMAMSANFFESAWPALIGWTSGFCVALFYIPQILMADYIWFVHCINANEFEPFPMDPEEILNLVYLLFGFGTYHLVKKKIVNK